MPLLMTAIMKARDEETPAEPEAIQVYLLSGTLGRILEPLGHRLTRREVRLPDLRQTRPLRTATNSPAATPRYFGKGTRAWVETYGREKEGWPSRSTSAHDHS